MTTTLTELLAASAMMLALERVASSGLLPIDEETDIRQLIVRAGKAFGLDSIAERPALNVIQIGDRDPAYTKTIEDVAREMGT